MCDSVVRLSTAVSSQQNEWIDCALKLGSGRAVTLLNITRGSTLQIHYCNPPNLPPSRDRTWQRVVLQGEKEKEGRRKGQTLSPHQMRFAPLPISPEIHPIHHLCLVSIFILHSTPRSPALWYTITSGSTPLRQVTLQQVSADQNRAESPHLQSHHQHTSSQKVPKSFSPQDNRMQMLELVLGFMLNKLVVLLLHFQCWGMKSHLSGIPRPSCSSPTCG